ncbi:thioredoxin family protein [Fructilactobacillus cliffordii]|uniref:Thioredoxin family protein n=1 Tax=Fructilactobacillus cliffordii TaxID=2940299 RepID=A0A9Q8ZQW7_9LACO|nr:thioredoxin family protein [Fructilactobacillus cliffordii]USS89980.1 thioredoxin family protein [Fructilactobacillus cliffordii]
MSKYNSIDDHYYYGPNRKMNPRTRKYIALISTIVVALIILIGVFFYFTFTAIPSNSKTVNQELSSSKLANSDVKIYFYRQGCSSCKKVRWQILRQEFFNSDSNVKYLNIDANNPKNKKLVDLYGINDTPTIIHLKNGVVVDHIYF